MNRVREENLNCIKGACDSVDHAVNEILSAASVIRRAIDTIQKGVEVERQLGADDVGVTDPLEAPEEDAPYVPKKWAEPSDEG